MEPLTYAIGGVPHETSSQSESGGVPHGTSSKSESLSATATYRGVRGAVRQRHPDVSYHTECLLECGDSIRWRFDKPLGAQEVT